MTTIWPQYINSNLSKSNGRKISKEKAVTDPSIREISKALKRLKIQHEMEEKKSYPGYWYEKSGRIIVENNDLTKIKLLENISEKIKEFKK